MIFYRMDFVKSVALVMTEQGLRPSRYLTPRPRNGTIQNVRFLLTSLRRLLNFHQQPIASAESPVIRSIYTDGASSVVIIGRNTP
jgi:hypothetical protein